MEVTLAERFPALTPLSIRKERAVDVFKTISKLNRFAKKQKKNEGKKKIIRRPASDNWF